MLVGVVVALGWMILRFIFSFYLLYLFLLLSLLFLQRWGESPKSWWSQWGGVCLSRRSYTRLSSVVPNSLGCYTSKWSGELGVVGMWLGPKQFCPVCIIWRVLLLRDWKDIFTNECTGWATGRSSRISMRFLIYCEVSDSQWVLYIESHSILKHLLQT